MTKEDEAEYERLRREEVIRQEVRESLQRGYQRNVAGEVLSGLIVLVFIYLMIQLLGQSQAQYIHTITGR